MTAVRSTIRRPLIPCAATLGQTSQGVCRAGENSLLMGRVLCLWWIQLHFDGLLLFVDFESLPESLISLGDNLHQNRPLRDGRNLRQTFLVRAPLPGRDDFLSELGFGTAFDEL